MMTIVALLLLTVFQFLIGFSIICLLRLRQKPVVVIAVSILLGIAVFSLVPFALELLRLPLTATAVFFSLTAICALLTFFSRRSIADQFLAVRRWRWKVRLYELPFLLLIAFMVFVSAWRCVYFPPTSRDLTSGPEVIAEYAVKEKTMVNSVFSVDLSTTNNQFKPPFITSLQVVYKYAGFPFGQAWLPVVVICFLLFLYQVLTQRLHSAIAGFLLVLFIAIPEMYAYTVMVLFDYSNAVFFCLSVFFLFHYFETGQRANLVLSGLLMGVATYIRSETLILAALLAFVIPFQGWKRKGFGKNTLRDGLFFLLPAVVLYFLSITVYITYYLPNEYLVGNLLNKQVYNPTLFFKRVIDTSRLLLSEKPNYFGYYGHVFCLVFVLNLFCRKPFNKISHYWLFAALIVFFGIALIGFLFPLYDLTNTTKRGLFKLFPLMLLFMGNSRLLLRLSNLLWKWEGQEARLVDRQAAAVSN